MIAILLALCLDPSCATLDPTDDALAWDYDGPVTTFEIMREGESEPCLIVAPELRSITVWATSCVAPSSEARLYARACNGPDNCGGFVGESVTYLPTMCIEGSVEVPCFEGAPLRTPPR